MNNLIIIIYFIFIGFLFVGCLGVSSFSDSVDYNNNKLEQHFIMDDKYIKKINIQISESLNSPAISRDRDDLTILKYGEDNNLEWYLSGGLDYNNKYIDYYYIVDRNTRQLIGWEFTNCDKRKIDPNDEKSYIKCLRDTRVNKEKNNIYRIGVNKTTLKKYGYKDEDKQTKSKDDMKIVIDVLKAEDLCTNGIDEILKKEYWGIEYNVRYYVKCKDSKQSKI